MSVKVFGPHYPPRLQDAVNQAERLSASLSMLETAGSERGDVWLIGRTEEIEKIVGLAVHDWREERRSEAQAAQAVRDYVKALLVDMRKIFGLGAVLDCCFSDAVMTVPVEGNDDETRHVALPCEAPSDTMVDPLAAVKWLPRKR